MTRERDLAAAEQQYAHWTDKARSLPHGSPEETNAWTLARHASTIIGQLRRQQLTIVLLCAVVYTGIQSARLITQPTRSNQWRI